MTSRSKPALPQLPREALPLAWLAMAAGTYAGIPALRRQVLLGYPALGVSLLADQVNLALALAAASLLVLAAARALSRRGVAGATLGVALLFGVALVALDAWSRRHGPLLPERRLLLQTITGALAVLFVARTRRVGRDAGSDPHSPAAARRAGWLGCMLLVLALNAARAAIGAAAGAPDVILIAVHALRADHVGALGDGRGLTPQLDALAEGGVLFEEALATTPDTASATRALLSAGGGPGRPAPPTLAEVLRAHGYATFGAAALPEVAAADRRPPGFEVFDDAPMRADDAVDSAARVTDAALAWLRTAPAQPVFVFAHYADPGLPWYYPDNSDDEPYAGPLNQPISRRALKLYGTAMTEVDRRYALDAYAAEVAYADRHVGRLLSGLRDAGRYEGAMIVVVGDHGIDLGAGRGSPPAGRQGLQREQVHVPLVLKLPGGQRVGARAAGPLSLSDLAGALTARLGIAWPASVPGARPPEPGVLEPDAAELRRRRGAYRELHDEGTWLQGVRVGEVDLVRDLYGGFRWLSRIDRAGRTQALDPDSDPSELLRLERLLDRHFHDRSGHDTWAIGARPTAASRGDDGDASGTASDGDAGAALQEVEP